jgi:hypothetical protein
VIGLAPAGVRPTAQCVARHVHLVVDRNAGDPELATLVADLVLVVPDGTVCVELVPERDSMRAGRVVAALALEGGRAGTVVAHDIGLRPDDPGPFPPGCELCFCVARSRTGVLVVGPNAGWTWSFAAQHELATQLIRIDVPPAGPPPEPATRLAMAVGHATRGHPHAAAGTIDRRGVPVPAAAQR